MTNIFSEAIRNLFHKPSTVKYPFVAVEPQDGFRGRPSVSKELCIHCWQCIRNCPDRAISVDKETKAPSIWLGRCTYCGECAEACPTKAIVMTKNFAYLDQYEK